MKFLYFLLAFVLGTMVVWGLPFTLFVFGKSDGALSIMAAISVLTAVFGGGFFLYKAIDYPSYDERKRRVERRWGYDSFIYFALSSRMDFVWIT